mgnify:CR=1 FL=1
MKIYSIKLIGGTSILGTDEDVARIVVATQKGMKLVRVRGSLINPSSISSITRSWESRPEDLEKEDNEIGALGNSGTKQIV